MGGDDTAVDGSRPSGSLGDQGSGTLRRNTIRGLIRGTFSRKGGLEAMESTEQEQAEDQRFYLQQRRDASKFTMVRPRAGRSARRPKFLTARGGRGWHGGVCDADLQLEYAKDHYRIELARSEVLVLTEKSKVRARGERCAGVEP